MFKPGARSIKSLTTYQATREIQPSASEAVRALKTHVRGPMKIRWNSRTGTPRSLRGILSEPGDGTAQEIAVQFLDEQKELFGIQGALDDLQCIQTTEHRGIRHVKLRQMYAGFPVFGAELNVHIDQADRVQMVNGEYCPDIELDMSQNLISKTTAINTALLHLEIEGSAPSEARSELVIFPKGDGYCQAYKVMLNTKSPLGDWVYFIDAVSGDILDGYNAMRFVKGKARVYNSNPKRDRDEVATVPLFDLEGDRSLSGTYFRVENDEGPEAIAGSAAHEFLYDPDNTHFDETMVYYHLSRIAEFFRNVGHAEHTTPMPAHVHVPDPDTGNPDYDNAYYSPRRNAFYFGHGEMFRDLAWEAAVVYHEYTHSVIEIIQPVMATHEAGALHEGYADYFACSITNDPQIGEFIVGDTGRPNLRNLRNEKTYRDFTGFDVHIDGEIWGITCWKIREALGSRAANRLLYESLWFLPTNATFADAYEGIAQADTHLFGGEHLEEIDDIFIEQKILSGQAESHTITAIAGDGGKITPAGEVFVEHEEEQRFTMTPNTGYVVKDVLVDGGSKGKGTDYTFEKVIASHTIEARFEKSDSYEWVVMVPGNTRWMDTGIMISRGDEIAFSAHGAVIYNRRGNSCGPEGTSWTDVRDKEDPLWKNPHAGLLAKIGEAGSPFFVGGSHGITAQQSGMLLLGINDYWYQGNSGEFTVTVNVSRVS